MKSIYRRNKSMILSVTAILTVVALSAYYIDLEINNIYSDETNEFVPISRIELYMFLIKPVLIIVPSILVVTIVGVSLMIRRNRFMVVVVPTLDKVDFPKEEMLTLPPNERLVLETLFSSSGSMLQVDLTKKTRLKPHNVTRILQRFEGLDWVVRKDFGQTNIVYLKLKPKTS